jgi:hypothetical protein
MTGFTPYPFSPRWSHDAQLFWGGGRGKDLRLTFYLPGTTDYDVLVYATLAPDFGIVRVQIDGQDVGSAIDAYAPNVRPSGAMEVCTGLELAEGWHRVTFTMMGTNEASTDERFGVDCLEFRPHDASRSAG